MISRSAARASRPSSSSSASSAVTVGSVDEALALLAAGESFDLVLADELMPGKGGLDLLAALRAESAPRETALRAAVAVRRRSCRASRAGRTARTPSA